MQDLRRFSGQSQRVGNDCAQLCINTRVPVPVGHTKQGRKAELKPRDRVGGSVLQTLGRVHLR